MSKRLQVILTDDDARELREMAAREGVTVSEWVRRTLRDERRRHTTSSVELRLDTVRTAAAHRFPAPDIEEMLDEIEHGYAT